jgi:hypothetical protein
LILQISDFPVFSTGDPDPKNQSVSVSPHLSPPTPSATSYWFYFSEELICPPKCISTQISLLGNRVSEEITKLSSSLIRVGPKSKDSLIGREEDTDEGKKVTWR